MTQYYKSACPLDCWDTCSFIIKVEQEGKFEILPDNRQSITGNFLCKKGRSHIEKIFHKDRVITPLLKKNGFFEPISWNEALDTITYHIKKNLGTHGSHSILHYHASGSGGLLKGVESRFFSALGGVSKHIGSLCWAAGIEGQKYDFGDSLSHSYQDVTNSKLILIWGRNPADTNVHLMPYLQEAKKKGAKIILIDPICTNTAKTADKYISIKPSTDGALALAMAHVLLRTNNYDLSFIEKYTTGFGKYREMIDQYTPEYVSGITGLRAEDIIELAVEYGTTKPASILIGYGLQRYTNSGNAIRAIDSLAALTGNIGIPGGGANYANRQVTKYYDHSYFSGLDLKPNHRYYKKPQLAKYITEENSPPIKMIFFTRSNPVTQMGDTDNLVNALDKVDFKVTIDMFLTDTAEASDLVLPCTSFIEEEDVYSTSMGHCYISYGKKIIEPIGESKSELWVFTQLAKRLDLDTFPDLTTEQWLNIALKPLEDKFRISLDDLKEKPVELPNSLDIPWSDRVFHTEDKRYNFYSDKAVRDGNDGLPVYKKTGELNDKDTRNKGYNLYFITPHPGYSLHSQHYVLHRDTPLPLAHIHPATAKLYGILEGDRVLVSSKRGSMKAIARLTDTVREDILMVYEGWWKKFGASVNCLTSDAISDMGIQAALYDCLCKIEKED